MMMQDDLEISKISDLNITSFILNLPDFLFPAEFKETIESHFFCHICLDISAQMQVLQCKHLVCESCLRSMKERLCPFCRCRIELNKNQDSSLIMRKNQMAYSVWLPCLKCLQLNNNDPKNYPTIWFGNFAQMKIHLKTHFQNDENPKILVCDFYDLGCSQQFHSLLDKQMHEVSTCQYGFIRCSKCFIFFRSQQNHSCKRVDLTQIFNIYSKKQENNQVALIVMAQYTEENELKFITLLEYLQKYFFFSIQGFGLISNQSQALILKFYSEFLAQNFIKIINEQIFPDLMMKALLEQPTSIFRHINWQPEKVQVKRGVMTQSLDALRIFEILCIYQNRTQVECPFTIFGCDYKNLEQFRVLQHSKTCSWSFKECGKCNYSYIGDHNCSKLKFFANGDYEIEVLLEINLFQQIDLVQMFELLQRAFDYTMTGVIAVNHSVAFRLNFNHLNTCANFIKLMNESRFEKIRFRAEQIHLKNYIVLYESLWQPQVRKFDYFQLDTIFDRQESLQKSQIIKIYHECINSRHFLQMFSTYQSYQLKY